MLFVCRLRRIIDCFISYHLIKTTLDKNRLFPILISMLAVITQNIGKNIYSFDLKLFSLFFVSSFMIYPEASLLVIALIIFSYFSVCREKKLLKSLFIIPFLLLVVALIDYDGVMKWFFYQVYPCSDEQLFLPLGESRELFSFLAFT